MRMYVFLACVRHTTWLKKQLRSVKSHGSSPPLFAEVPRVSADRVVCSALVVVSESDVFNIETPPTFSIRFVLAASCLGNERVPQFIYHLCRGLRVSRDWSYIGPQRRSRVVWIPLLYYLVHCYEYLRISTFA